MKSYYLFVCLLSFPSLLAPPARINASPKDFVFFTLVILAPRRVPSILDMQ